MIKQHLRIAAQVVAKIGEVIELPLKAIILLVQRLPLRRQVLDLFVLRFQLVQKPVPDLLGQRFAARLNQCLVEPYFLLASVQPQRAPGQSEVTLVDLSGSNANLLQLFLLHSPGLVK